MSAWFKSKYNTHVQAAWSSSGVIHAVEDFHMYDLDVMYTVQNSSLLCAKKIRFFSDLIDQAFTIGGQARKEEIITAFNGTDFTLTIFDFQSLIADIFAGFVQGGNHTGLCDEMTSDSFMKDPIGHMANISLS